jgi:hypothetical protein
MLHLNNKIMPTKNTFIAVLIFTILVLHGCLSKKISATSVDTKEYFILSVQDKFKDSNINNDVNFYCLLYINETELKKVLNNLYVSRYSFYDTLCNNANAKCILNYWEKYWTNSCAMGKLNQTLFSLEDSAINSITVKKLQNRLNYSYKDLSINSKDILQIGLHVGIAKAKSLECCKILEKSFCDLPSDTIVILKHGFTMTKQKL